MNSPQPLSAPQRGAKPSSPSLQSREGERGGEYIHKKAFFRLLLFIPDSNLIYYEYRESYTELSA